MDYCISKTIGFGICSMSARWKIPAIYTIVEVLDFAFVESTGNEIRVFPIKTHRTNTSND